MTDPTWKPSATAPIGVEVETRVRDVDGIRNVATLVRKDMLWWFPDFSMYIYYEPTEWRPLQPQD